MSAKTLMRTIFAKLRKRAAGEQILKSRREARARSGADARTEIDSGDWDLLRADLAVA